MIFFSLCLCDVLRIFFLCILFGLHAKGRIRPRVIRWSGCIRGELFCQPNWCRSVSGLMLRQLDWRNSAKSYSWYEKRRRSFTARILDVTPEASFLLFSSIFLANLIFLMTAGKSFRIIYTVSSPKSHKTFMFIHLTFRCRFKCLLHLNFVKAHSE